MKGPLNINLSDYAVSSRYGFLPDELPLEQLPSYYEGWEEVVRHLAPSFNNRTFRTRIEKLAVLSTSRLETDREWQRAYVLLAFMTHAYIWGGETPAEILPPCISIPILKVAEHLGIPPAATAASLCLWNFSALPSSDLLQMECLRSLHTFTGTKDEEWFYLISITIEARGASIIPTMLKAINAARSSDSQTVIECLREFPICVDDIVRLLNRMYEHCGADAFYHRIRPVLAGSKNMEASGLPYGVFYPTSESDPEKGSFHRYSGGSNAQSSIIQFLDLVLGIRHFPTKVNGEAPREKHSFHKEMRQYMPGPHRAFLEVIEREAGVREYVEASADEELTSAYNEAVDSLGRLRDSHIRMVTRYIVSPAAKGNAQGKGGVGGGLNLAVASMGKKDGLEGTGGTQLMPFLKQSRDETKERAFR
ncbi:Indoleamine 2,3-dioxygenase [Bisporella sp. PMI_857]|nr:Indoleamine 2,3-dioxygenase [Bisporella sp. PMI_857]